MSSQFFPRLIGRTLLAGALTLPAFVFAQPGAHIEVWKTATCGCCKDWVKHLESNGFAVSVNDVEDTTDAREKYGMPNDYASCHTALIEGYAIEGHVSAAEIRRLLQEKPDAVGLTAPGMPVGSPGMDGPEYGGRKHAYDVYLIARDGQATVYQSHR